MSNPNPNQSPKKSGNSGKNPENKPTKPESKSTKPENPSAEGGAEKSKADLRRERNRIQVCFVPLISLLYLKKKYI